MSDSPPVMPAHYVAAVEALLFAAEAPVAVETLRDALSRADDAIVPTEWVEAAVDAVRTMYGEGERGFHLVEVGAGWEFRTRPVFAAYVHQLYRNPPARLSRAMLEVLAVVAYRQPCTRADIEDVRGVDCSRMLRTLLERELIRIIGKADEVGRPLLYGTTPTFLAFFGLNSLAELPTLREYTELTEDHLVRLQALDETLRAGAPAPEAAQLELVSMPIGANDTPHDLPEGSFPPASHTPHDLPEGSFPPASDTPHDLPEGSLPPASHTPPDLPEGSFGASPQPEGSVELRAGRVAPPPGAYAPRATPPSPPEGNVVQSAAPFDPTLKREESDHD